VDRGFDDLHGSIQMTVLLVLPVVTAGVVQRYFGKPTPQRWLRAAGFALLLVMTILLVSFRRHGLGFPVAQWVVPLGCVFAAAYMDGARTQAVMSTLSLVAALGLCAQYSTVIHRQYVGSSSWFELHPPPLRDERAAVIGELRADAGSDPMEYLPEYLSEGEMAFRHPRIRGRSLERFVAKAARLWHSWLTGLYARKPVRAGLYFPGGGLEKNLDRIEWREFPGQE